MDEEHALSYSLIRDYRGHSRETTTHTAFSWIGACVGDGSALYTGDQYKDLLTVSLGQGILPS